MRADGLPPTSFNPQKPFHSNPILGCVVSLGAQHTMEKTEVLDGRCMVSPGLKFRSYDGLSDLPRHSSPRDEESSEDDRPFQPRFLLQEIIFAHSPQKGVFDNRPTIQGNLLCRSDSLCLRGIEETDCAILPIRELAAYPRSSACEHFRSGERPSGRWPFPVTSTSGRIQLAVRSSSLVRELGQSRQPLLRAHRQYLRLRFGSLEIASGCGHRTVEKQRVCLVSPFVPLVCALSPRARVNLV